MEQISDSSELEELRIVEEGDEINTAINGSIDFARIQLQPTTYNERSVDVITPTRSNISVVTVLNNNTDNTTTAATNCHTNSSMNEPTDSSSVGIDCVQPRTNGSAKHSVNLSYISEPHVPPVITITEAIGDNAVD